MNFSAQLRDAALDLAWSLWSELGVSTWARAHEDWAVEVEPLVAFTALVGGHDRRLLRESLDWCIAYDDLVSLHQLRGAIAQQGWPMAGAIADFSVTVSQGTRRPWPGASEGEPLDVGTRGRSHLRDPRSRSTLQLRLRAVFGVSARAEVIRVLLTGPTVAWSTARIAERAGYTRRQVDLALEALTLGGVVRRRRTAGPATYTLVEPAALVRLVGPLPLVAPRWAPTLRLVHGLLVAAETLEASAPSMPAAELARQRRLLERPLQDSGVQPPALPTGEQASLDAMQTWATDVVTRLARGDHGVFSDDVTVRAVTD